MEGFYQWGFLCQLRYETSRWQLWFRPYVEGHRVASSVESGSSSGKIDQERSDPWKLCGLNFSLPALVEFKAIKVGMSKFFNSAWSESHRLIVESDCKTVVDWINGMVDPPSSIGKEVNDVAVIILVKGISLSLIPRCCNVVADSLAKSGINQCGRSCA
ncbi:hypothetical protein V6N11_021493 [Hibiscus sabdariffa]|uniref:RNase H type-1 domain-containing protein n=2 Tax=Hibiscus sabdariffa TaxID=183260 RepID=A0ABR1ZUY4_9ROSI